MPTYEYECGRCGALLEIFHFMSSPPKSVCPKCKGRLKRLLGTGAGLLFKGSGFYITDYRSKSYREAARKESGSAAAPQTASSASKVKKEATSK